MANPGKINLGLDFVGLLLAIPENAPHMRPEMDLELGGYIASAVLFAWGGVSGCWDKLGDAIDKAAPSTKFFLKTVETMFSAMVLLFYTDAITAQIKTAATDWGEFSDQKDSEDLNLQIGTLTCDFASMLGKWFLSGLGSYIVNEGNEPVGKGCAYGGMGTDLLANAAGRVVNFTRCEKEIKASKSQEGNKGVYVGIP